MNARKAIRMLTAMLREAELHGTVTEIEHLSNRIAQWQRYI